MEVKKSAAVEPQSSFPHRTFATKGSLPYVQSSCNPSWLISSHGRTHHPTSRGHDRGLVRGHGHGHVCGRGHDLDHGVGPSPKASSVMC